jgi:hypothetical protein
LVENWSLTDLCVPKFLQSNSKADMIVKLLAKEDKSEKILQVFKMKVSIESIHE